MTRHTWDDLPAIVRATIERKCGRVVHAEIPSAGRNSDFSATLHLPGGKLFCKGIADAKGPRGGMHRHEAYINPWLPSAAPRLLWKSEVDSWLLLGFEHAAGRHADFSPGSPDLPLAADAISGMTRELARCPAEVPRLAEKWARIAGWRRLAKNTPGNLDTWAREHLDQLVEWEAQGVEAADGDSLTHTDLHELNIIVGKGRARIVDWAWARKGNPVTDIALLVIRLINAGHTPAAAEQWARELPTWTEAPEATRTAIAATIWGSWEYLERSDPLPHRAALTTAARTWARHRLT